MNPSNTAPICICHYEDPWASVNLTRAAAALLAEYGMSKPCELAFFCIGTDRATGDCLGPLVGSRLQTLLPGASIFGTLEKPLHALNLQEAVGQVKRSCPYPRILAVDACLGSTHQVGSISLKRGALRPGSALKKTLPEVGDCHITGVVNVSGFCEQLVLQNTRLYVVQKMADIIARSLFMAHPSICRNRSKLAQPPSFPCISPASFVNPDN